MESLVAICPPDVDPIVLEVEAMGRRRDVSGDIRESVQLLECRGVHTLRTLASITKPEKGKAGVEVGNCDLTTAGGQRTTELWEHDLGTIQDFHCLRLDQIRLTAQQIHHGPHNFRGVV